MNLRCRSEILFLQFRGDVVHRRSVAACLVQATYVLEHDRRNNCGQHNALAPAWWQFFGFQLLEKLSDEGDSFFGAVFKLERSSLPAPAYVVAFRGTITTCFEDLKHNIHLFLHKLHNSCRTKVAVEAVRSRIAPAGSVSGGGGAGVWLAGHSLGSSVAMAVGKALATEGVFLESFLFNPPYLSLPLHTIKNQNVKNMLEITNIIGKSVIVFVAETFGDSSVAALFEIISGWVPSLFVNPSDVICAEYIEYFKVRERMAENELGFVRRTFARASISATILTICGEETAALHLLPSAELHVSSCATSDRIADHSIEQWWRSDLVVTSRRYHYHSE
ncbi:unnamed protein product [Spirodela intermedia]|uniref:Uncharacterized protein n=1 Tax=Spirodela intermedia TaxID=51605 RepID=A0A7I8KY71_SPIIN|nr:unnamed protein product [Spirodela intermedia]